MNRKDLVKRYNNECVRMNRMNILVVAVNGHKLILSGNYCRLEETLFSVHKIINFFLICGLVFEFVMLVRGAISKLSIRFGLL